MVCLSFLFFLTSCAKSPTKTWRLWEMHLQTFHISFPFAGYLISLKDPEFALSVEVCLKGQLQAFTCDNHEDEKVLQSLMYKMFPTGRRPAIITSNFLSSVHDTRMRWGHEQYSKKQLYCWSSFDNALLGNNVSHLHSLVSNVLLKGHILHEVSLKQRWFWLVLSFCQRRQSSWIPLRASSAGHWGSRCGQLLDWPKGNREHSTH